MYLIRKIKQFVRVALCSFLLWIVLSTVLPNIDRDITYSTIPASLRNARIQLLIAHPDDEVMFFAPTLIELNKLSHNNSIKVTCFSNGNDQGLGETRHHELLRSLDILGIKDREIIEDESIFPDSMDLEWDTNEILGYIDKDADVLLTFDELGISKHPNHISLYKAAIDSKKVVFSLKTWSYFQKYSSTLYTNFLLALWDLNYLVVELIPERITHIPSSSHVPFFDKFFQGNVLIFSDLPSLFLGIAAMTSGHESQMVWFRWGWLVLSRYGNANELILQPS